MEGCTKGYKQLNVGDTSLLSTFLILFDTYDLNKVS